jgi:hypothetical protein
MVPNSNALNRAPKNSPSGNAPEKFFSLTSKTGYDLEREDRDKRGWRDRVKGKMLKQIISSGRTGAARAALDTAIELGLLHGGWIPRGGKTEFTSEYRLQECPTGSLPDCMEKNMSDSDGTLILSYGELSGEMAPVLAAAEKHGRPFLHLELHRIQPFLAARKIQSWVDEREIEVMHVEGAGDAAKMYQVTKQVLKTVISLDLIGAEMPDPSRRTPLLPDTVEEAVERLVAGLTLKDKAAVAQMEKADLEYLLPTLGEYIWEKYGLGSENKDLLHSCRIRSGEGFKEEDCPAVILEALLKRLKETHRLRVIKK